MQGFARKESVIVHNLQRPILLGETQQIFLIMIGACESNIRGFDKINALKKFSFFINQKAAGRKCGKNIFFEYFDQISLDHFWALVEQKFMFCKNLAKFVREILLVKILQDNRNLVSFV